MICPHLPHFTVSKHFYVFFPI
ncbi:hypothetical protein EMIT0347P_20355 [Pseudomonas sp. IT-347P]